MDPVTAKHFRRMIELFKPIEQQIMMTDDVDDLILLSTVMITTAKKIYVNRYGEEEAKELMKTIIES
jgi:hypothetical protein